jgi:hypothetical protein
VAGAANRGGATAEPTDVVIRMTYNGISQTLNKKFSSSEINFSIYELIPSGTIFTKGTDCTIELTPYISRNGVPISIDDNELATATGKVSALQEFSNDKPVYEWFEIGPIEKEEYVYTAYINNDVALNTTKIEKEEGQYLKITLDRHTNGAKYTITLKAMTNMANKDIYRTSSFEITLGYIPDLKDKSIDWANSKCNPFTEISDEVGTRNFSILNPFDGLVEYDKIEEYYKPVENGFKLFFSKDETDGTSESISISASNFFESGSNDTIGLFFKRKEFAKIGLKMQQDRGYSGL